MLSEIFNLKRNWPRNLHGQICNFCEQVVGAGCKLLRANCQSKYQHCGGSLQSCAEKNIRFNCNKAHTRQLDIFDANSIVLFFFNVDWKVVNGDFCFMWNHCNCDLVSILNFELVVCNVCPKQHRQAARSQKLLLSKALFEAVLQYSHWKIQEKHCLWIKRMSQQLTISICVGRPIYRSKIWVSYHCCYRQRNLLKKWSYAAKYQEANVPVKCSRMQYLRCEYCNIWKFVFLPCVMFL